ncbi:hypothetical protein SSX86_024149 [Deinandra increscens subsp. villosa]|uniref:RNA-directed DNA polymerase, eukaryota n=1 Tax=Deinandra increscens subsp. villosa TaxID=3103831 RepID=A0AAP0CHG7_9ASTR
MVENVKSLPTDRLWGRTVYEHEAVPAVGKSGGLLCIWDPGVFNKVEAMYGRYMLAIRGKIMGGQEDLTIVNVYGPQSPSLKKELWDQVVELKQRWGGMWVVLGDFNAVRSAEERLNSEFCTTTARDFNQFINNMELIDPKMGGHKYTFMDSKGEKLSKIDTIMYCRKFLDCWPTTRVTALPRNKPDHAPVMLEVGCKVDFGPIPFKCFHSWFEREGFESTMRLAYALAPIGLQPDRALLLKLQAIKKALKLWWQEEKEKEKKEEMELKDKIENVESIAEQRPLTLIEKENRIIWKKELLELEFRMNKDVQQKAKIKWAIEGDENTKFFHGMVKARMEKNRISGLIREGGWCSNPGQLKEMVKNHFSQRFYESKQNRPTIDGRGFSKLSEEQMESLVCPVTMQ